MTLFATFKASSVYQKVALILLLIALYCAWASLVGAAWGDGYVTSGSPDTLTGYGLLHRCGDDDITSECTNLLGWNLGWYRAVQAFAIIGFICVHLSAIAIILLMFVSTFQQSKTLTAWAAVLSCLSALSYLIAVIVFAFKFDSTFEMTSSDNATVQYGWGLAIAVVALDIVTGIMMVLDSRRVGAKIMDL